jgi:hypothetical protein
MCMTNVIVIGAPNVRLLLPMLPMLPMLPRLPRHRAFEIVYS